MNLFTLLLVGHLVGDFLLQTSWMADNKTKDWAPLLVHCSVYTLIVVLFALPVKTLPLPAVALIFFGHIVIDRTGFVYLWAKYISRSPHITWLKMVQDQVWHVLILAAVTLF